MNTTTVPESGMVFTFPTVDILRIEICSTAATIGPSVKIVEMIVIHNHHLYFIEAKSSSPHPGSAAKLDEYVQDIYEKFRNSLIIFAGLLVNRPFKQTTPLPSSFTPTTLAKIPIHFCLIINGHEEEWLPPLSDAFNMRQDLAAINKCFVIKSTIVLNDTMARKYGLIVVHNYHIAFDPDLGVSAQDFIRDWNATPACRALAEAQPDTQGPSSFSLDPQMLQQGLVLLSGMVGAASGLVLDTLKDAVKDRLAEYFKDKLSKKPTIKVSFVRQPGGGLLIVTEESA